MSVLAQKRCNAPGRLFRRHVRKRAQNLAFLGNVFGGIKNLGQAEIAHQRLSISVQKNVARFEITMQNALYVGVSHGASDLRHQADRPARIGLILQQPAGQAAAVSELHDEKWIALLLAMLIDLDDVGVVELGDGTGFLVESFQFMGVRTGARTHGFQGHDPIEARVAYLEDEPHASRG